MERVFDTIVRVDLIDLLHDKVDRWLWGVSHQEELGS